jgi:acyl-CoA thioesterase
MAERTWPPAVETFLTPGGGAAGLLGIVPEDARPGHARLSLRVREDMTNPFGICHGGVIFALADTAIGFASNAKGGVQALTQHCLINYLSPAHVGDTLTAEARETARTGKNAVFDAHVVNQRGETIATFRGMTFDRAGAQSFKGESNG